MNAYYSVNYAGLQDAVRTYAVQKGKTEADAINKAMRFWIPFASNKVTRTSAATIRSELTGQPKRISRGAIKSKKQISNTLAAAIVAARWRRRGIPLTRESADNFYHAVTRLINSRARGSGYLKAGFIPAMQKFNVPRRGVPNQRAKGRSMAYRAKPVGGALEAFARNAREGVSKRFPRCFLDSIPQVTAQFRRWLEQDMTKTAKRSGFY